MSHILGHKHKHKHCTMFTNTNTAPCSPIVDVVVVVDIGESVSSGSPGDET